MFELWEIVVIACGGYISYRFMCWWFKVPPLI